MVMASGQRAGDMLDTSRFSLPAATTTVMLCWRTAEATAASMGGKMSLPRERLMREVEVVFRVVIWLQDLFQHHY